MAPPRPPPVTPSPHRFVIKKERVRAAPLTQEDNNRPGQFNAAPRFNFSSTPRQTPRPTLTPKEQPRATPSASRFLTPAPRTVNQRDAIEDSADEILQESIESEDQDVEIEYGSPDADDYITEEPIPKRRRLSSSPQPDLLGDGENDEVKPFVETLDELLSSSLPILSSPPTTKRPVSTTAPRFLLSTPAPPASSQVSAQPAFLKPPRFRPPDPAEQSETQPDPLPDQFSPHRKGQKYVSGGLAAEVRDWLVNIESSIPTTAQRGKEDLWLVKILVDEAKGGGRAGMSLITGRQVHEGGIVDTLAVQVILAGEGAGSGLQKGSPVVPGKTVGFKGPVWEVVVEGQKWGVVVDWKVLF